MAWDHGKLLNMSRTRGPAARRPCSRRLLKMYFWLTPRGASGPTISALTMSSVTIEQPAWLATFLAKQGDRTNDVPSDRTQLVAQHVVRAYWDALSAAAALNERSHALRKQQRAHSRWAAPVVKQMKALHQTLNHGQELIAPAPEPDAQA